MKTRNGFVSNSSTSSFCIFGVSMGDDEFRKFVDRNMQLILAHTAKSKWMKEVKTEEDLKQWQEEKGYYGDLLHTLAEGVGLEAYYPPDWEMVFIGASWPSILDDETGAQFKERVAAMVAQLFPDAVCGTHQEGYYS